MNYPKILYSYPESAGEKFQPSNGTEGMIFTEHFCGCCVHEKFIHTAKHGDKQCDILTNTMCFGVNDENYPKEWQYGEDGYPHCTKWVKFDWDRDDDNNVIDPPPEPIDDPNQLVMPFILDEILKEQEEFA